MDEEKQEDVSLHNLMMGAAVERFDDALKEVLKNILDPNTTLAAREITLKVKIKPDADRGFGRLDLDCKAKLAPAAPLGTKIFIAATKNGACATEYVNKQQALDFGAEAGKLVSIRNVGGGK